MVSELQDGDPRQIGPYALLRRLGGGGMGRVYLGRSAGGRLVAVKVIRTELADDPSFRARFTHEVAAARRVNGLYTALVVDADPDGPVPWLATAYVPGPSLSEAVAAHGPLPEATLLPLAAALAEGLAAIHAAGVVHRDLKPSNVLLASDGPRVIDFGISRAVEASALTGTNLLIGSPGFMSPEQAVGHDVGPPSDVFSLGAVLTFAATAEGPFGTGPTPALLFRIVHNPPNIGRVPGSILPIVERCLIKDPWQRPAAAGLLAEIGPTPLVDNWLSVAGQAPAPAQGWQQPAAPAPGPAQAPGWQPPAAAPAQAWQPQAPLPPATWQPPQRGESPTVTSPGYPAGPGYPAEYGITPAPGYPAGAASTRQQRRRAGLPRLAWAAGIVVAACVAAAAVLVGIHVAHAAGQPGRPPQATTASYDAAIGAVVRPSARKGGTIVYDNSSTPDSTDPGNMYDAFSWDFSRLFTMPLMTTRSCPGACGEQVVPDLATAPGAVSDNGLTWTFHIQPDVKFEDGTTVTSQDVKYAVERSFAKSVLQFGPSYFQQLLGGNAATYPGPYQDRAKNLMGLTAVDTPDATTIVFHLAHPFADFNYVAAIPQTSPVPPGKDTGAGYQTHPVSTGPYKFAGYQQGKQITLVPNGEWNPSTDPNAAQLADKIIVNLNVGSAQVDSQLLAGGAQMDQAGDGVQTATRARILSSPSLKANADDANTGGMPFVYISTKVAPLNNPHCRMAVEYAADKTALQAAYGGPAAGDIASTAMPPTILGYRSFDLYHALTEPGGDLAAARAQLTACGHPNGFSTNLAYRSDSGTEAAAAGALRIALARAGISVTLHGYSTGNYFLSTAGSPAYVHSHDLGLDFGDWLADWPDAWGWFDSIVNGNAIFPTGNVNIAELNDPVVNGDLAAMQQTTDASARNAYANKIDVQVMNDAVILPVVYSKALLYRSPGLTNIYVSQYFGMYNYAVLGRT
jgi:peptide/nickel transport system substrate-binding protein